MLIKQQASYSAKQKCYIFVNMKNCDAQTCNEASTAVLLYCSVLPSKFMSCIYKLGQLFRDIKTSLRVKKVIFNKYILITYDGLTTEKKKIDNYKIKNTRFTFDRPQSEQDNKRYQ